MTAPTTISPSTIITAPTSAGRSIRRTAAIAGVVAAVATTVIGAVAKAADVPLVIGDLEIQVPMFAVFTLAAAALGAVIATQLQKRNRQPRPAFVITTVVLSALSVVPDLAAEATTATKLTLIGAHLVAAAVIIPAVAARLTTGRSA
jgi:hypothetical protein